LDIQSRLEILGREYTVLVEMVGSLASTLAEGKFCTDDNARSLVQILESVENHRRGLLSELSDDDASNLSIADLRSSVERYIMRSVQTERAELVNRFNLITSDEGRYAEEILHVKNELKTLLDKSLFDAPLYEIAQLIISQICGDLDDDVLSQIGDTLNPRISLGLARNKYYFLDTLGSKDDLPTTENLNIPPGLLSVPDNSAESISALDKWERENLGFVTKEDSGRVPSGIKRLNSDLARSVGDRKNLLALLKKLVEQVAVLMNCSELDENDKLDPSLTITNQNIDFLYRRGYINKYTLLVEGKYAPYSGRIMYSRSLSGGDLIYKVIAQKVEYSCRPFGDVVSMLQFLAHILTEDFAYASFTALKNRGLEKESSVLVFNRAMSDILFGAMICSSWKIFSYVIPAFAFLKDKHAIESSFTASKDVAMQNGTGVALVILGDFDEATAIAEDLTKETVWNGIRILVADLSQNKCSLNGAVSVVDDAISTLYCLDELCGTLPAENDDSSALDDAADLNGSNEPDPDEGTLPKDDIIELSSDEMIAKSVLSADSQSVDKSIATFDERNQSDLIAATQEETLILPSDTEYKSKLTFLLSKHHFADAYVLAKAYAFVSDEYGQTYKRLQYAMDYPWDSHKYESSELEALDISGYDEPYLLKTTVLLRAAFAPEIKHDHKLIAMLKGFLSEITSYNVPYETSIRSLFSSLIEALKDIPSGFSPAARQTLLGEGKRNERMHIISRNARDMLTVPNFDVKLTGATQLRDRVFGQNSQLRKVLEGIASDDSSSREDAVAYYNTFAFDGGIDNSLVEDYIQREWDAVKNSRMGTLKHSLHEKASKNLRRRLLVIAEWIELTDKGNVTGSETLERHSNRVSNKLNHVVLQLADSESAGDAILLRMAKRLLALLSGHSDAVDSDVRSLLLKPYVRLTEDFEPVFEKKLSEIPGCEPWRLALQNADYTISTPGDTLSKTDDPTDIDWFRSCVHRFPSLRSRVCKCEIMKKASSDAVFIS
jgi:hypothetical protein